MPACSFEKPLAKRGIRGSTENCWHRRFWAADPLPDLLLTVSVSGTLGPFANCHRFVCRGGAGRFDKHLASTIHRVGARIISFVQRREQRGRVRAAMSPNTLGGD